MGKGPNSFSSSSDAKTSSDNWLSSTLSVAVHLVEAFAKLHLI